VEPPLVPTVHGKADEEWLRELFSAMREWVQSNVEPSFAIYVFDEEFAYLSVAAPGIAPAQLMFDRENASAYVPELSTSHEVDAGANGVAIWAKECAPMFTCASVIRAFAECGGSSDGVKQLMRVFNIDLPHA
jgi:hypothetical protein